MKTSLIRKLKKSKEYRDGFVDSEISVGLPFQIRALREQRGWSQKDLADATAMLQPRICAMEQAGYGNFTLSTLKKLASAFDIGLLVRFASFGELANLADAFSPDTFSVPSSKDDPVLNVRERGADLRAVKSEPSGIESQFNQAASRMSALLDEALKSTSPSLGGMNERPLEGGAAMAASEWWTGERRAHG
jgi:transcriptional regulator with XRE-family HTH domain